MKIFTIGFAQKSAEEFFNLLIQNKVECLIDVRLNNSSQLAAFTKHKDLEYFLKTIAKINYIHNVKYAPTKNILDDYKKGKIARASPFNASEQESWQDYEVQYNKLISNRKIENLFKNDVENKYSNICFLCSESEPAQCHRRLLAEYLKNFSNDIEIVHL